MSKNLSIFPSFFLGSIKWILVFFSILNFVLCSIASCLDNEAHFSWLSLFFKNYLVTYSQQWQTHIGTEQPPPLEISDWLHGLILIYFSWWLYLIFYSALFKFNRLLSLFCCHIFHIFKVFVITVALHFKLPVYRFAIKANHCSALSPDPCDLMIWNYVSLLYQEHI